MNIKELIPQREPILMVDRVASHSNEKTETTFLKIKTNIFVEDGCFRSSGIIENIAQSAAVRMGMKTIKENTKPALGYIAAIKNLEIFCFPNVGETLSTEIVVTNQINNILVVNAICRIDNKIVANCELKVFIEI